MTDTAKNLILAHWRSTRGDIAPLAPNVDTLTMRVESLEAQIAGLRRNLVLTHGGLAAMSQRLDHHETRLEGTEKRLELADWSLFA